MKPSVSIIIPNYNCTPYLRTAVESALAQTHQPLEVVLVDDGSTDDSLTTIADLVATGQLRLVRQPNQGVAAARNAGLQASTGDYLVFLDCDDYIDPHMVERLAALINHHDPCVFAYCDYMKVDVTGKILPHNYSTADLRTTCEGNLLGSLLPDNFLLPMSVLISRHLFERAGGFDPQSVPCDDYDLWLRVSCLGGVARYLHEPLAFYRQRPASQSADRERMILAERTVIQRIVSQYPDQVAACALQTLEEFRRSVDVIRRDAMRSLDECEQYALSLSNTVREHETAIANAEVYTHSLHESLTTREAYIQSLHAALDEREAQFRQAEQYARSLQAALDEREAQFRQAEQYAHALRAALDEREAQFRQAEQYAHALRAALDEREAEAGALPRTRAL